MNGKNLNGIIDKVGTLVVNQNERAIECGQNEFINELNCEYSHVGP